MEHFDLVEKLVNAFGVSYEQAKSALENCDWDAAEAAVLIERQLNGSAAETPQTAPEGAYTAAQETPAETREQKIPQPEPDFFTQKQTQGTEEFRKFRESAKGQGIGLLRWIIDFLTKNSLVVKKTDGQMFLDLPIWLTAVLLLAAFWPVVLILGIVFVMGYRFSFEGPQLGKDSVRKVVNSVENAGESILHNVKYGVSQPSDNVQRPQEGTQPENNTFDRE